MSPSLLCPGCQASIDSASARFCECCGYCLSNSAVGDQAPALLPAPAPSACKSCLADPIGLDADGFCSACGMRPSSKPAARASFELGPHLACASDVGRRHAVNQDAACIAEVGLWTLMAVADGVSSSHLAERASLDATQAWLAATRLALESGSSPDAAMDAGLRAAHQATLLIAYAPDASNLDEPESTIVASICGHGQATIGWAGDSRAYGFLPGDPNGRLLTRDDSWLQSALDSGISERVAERDPRAHAITQCLGTRDEPPIPHIESFDLRPGELLLLCSDGLWNYLATPGQIGASLGKPTALAACSELADRANAHGGRDNITIALWRPSAS